MKITIEPTADLLGGSATAPALRIWRGKSETGEDCLVLVSGLVFFGEGPTPEGLRETAAPKPWTPKALLVQIGAYNLALRGLGCPEDGDPLAWVKAQRAYVEHLERLAGPEGVGLARSLAQRATTGGGAPENSN